VTFFLFFEVDCFATAVEIVSKKYLPQVEKAEKTKVGVYVDKGVGVSLNEPLLALGEKR